MTNDATYNGTQNHSVEFKSIQLVAGEGFLNIRFNWLFDEVSGELICIWPDLLEDSVQPFATLDIWEEPKHHQGKWINLSWSRFKCFMLHLHPGGQIVQSCENYILIICCGACFRNSSSNVVLRTHLVSDDAQQKWTQEPCDRPVHVADEVHDSNDSDLLGSRVDDRDDSSLADLLVELGIFLRYFFAVRHLLRYTIYNFPSSFSWLLFQKLVGFTENILIQLAIHKQHKIE